MKNEERLKNSYEKQKVLFEDAKNRKIQNLRKRKQQIEEKVTKLQMQISDLDREISEASGSSFQSFEDYLQHSRQSSLTASRTEEIPSNTSIPNSDLH